MKLIMLVGFIGSGKSTWARKYAEENEKAVIVNRDALMTMLCGKYEYSIELEQIVLHGALEFARDALCRGYDVIIDETNLTKECRAMWTLSFCGACIPFETAKKIERQVIHFSADKGNVERRMKGDARGISKEKWEEVFEEQKARFEPIKRDEFPAGTKIEVLTLMELTCSFEKELEEKIASIKDKKDRQRIEEYREDLKRKGFL